jgi:hypothetical protein
MSYEVIRGIFLFPFSKKWTITEDKGENMKKKFIMHISDETKL